MNIYAMNMGVQISFEIIISFPLNIYSEINIYLEVGLIATKQFFVKLPEAIPWELHQYTFLPIIH